MTIFLTLSKVSI